MGGGLMQVYRARNPRKSPLWQCAHRHYDEFEQVYPEAYHLSLSYHFITDLRVKRSRANKDKHFLTLIT